tara:strand:- start:973 stop:7617 length:6645 start_codon:yes stop_codon:yes gene_type:complete
LPEVINSADAVNVLSRDDELYPRDAAVSQAFFAFEKSMYGIVSQEMVNYFGTIVEFNNLVGDVVNKYRGDYKGLRLLRQLFFEKIQNNPDLDKFIEYYKWIDNSLGIFLQQLVPASADVSSEIRTVVEDHILSRSKYDHKYPQLDYKGNERFGGDEAKLEARVKGIEELTYNWQFGHAPLPNVAATATWTFTDKGNEETTITLTDSKGTSVVFEVDQVGDGLADAGSGNTLLGGGSGFANSAAGMAGALIAAVNASALNITATTGGGATGEVLLTQDAKGENGNTTITLSNYSNWNANTSATFPTSFTGGSTPQSKHSLWWRRRAERSALAFNTAVTIDTARQDLNDIILSFNSASAEEFNKSTGIGNVYGGSTYALRTFAQTTRTTVDLEKKIGGGYNYPPGHRPDALFSITKRGTGATDKLTVSKGSFKDLDIAEAGAPIVTIKRRFDDPLGTDNQNQNGYSTGKNGIPAVLYSSSAGLTGYRANTTGIEFAGFHNDSYGPEYDVPMQGPFSDAHVGGYRHRHEDLTGDPTLTSSTTRAEAWYRDGANYSSADYNFTRPSASPQYRRGEGVKRPVNIENIQHRTGSNTVRMGNFDKRYEVVMTNSRRTNNSQFVKNEGFSTASVTTDVTGYVENLIDYVKPVRARTEHVIVNRFSAPGGPETAGDTQGGAGLDFASSELSPYNSLNYRNLTIRQPLRTLLTERSEQFGLRSGSAVSTLDYTSVTASFHKVNRNGVKRLVSSSAGPVTEAVYDNYYIQHMIPQSDFQYAWITASHKSTEGVIYGYLPYDGLASSSAGLVSAINFVSASNEGTIKTAAARFISENNDNNFVFTDYVGLNTTIIEPISASDFTVGYPLTSDVRHYYNHSNIGVLALGATNYESFVESLSVGKTATDIELKLSLNHILSHRGGVYGYNTWKQQRVSEGRLPRHFRENNIYTHTPKVGEPITVTVPGGTTTVPVRSRASIQHQQSPIDTTFRPLKYRFEVRTNDPEESSTIIVKSSYENELTYFANPVFNKEIGVRIRPKNTSYRSLYRMYSTNANRAANAIKDESSPIVDLLALRYSEIVYPSRKNLYRNIIRGRTGFENNFWRDSRTDRTTKGESKKPTNVGGTAVNQSAWALDAQEDFAGFAPSGFPDRGGLSANNASGVKPGQLQNMYMHFHAGTSSNIVSGLLYSRKQVYPLSGAVVAPWGMEIPELGSATSDKHILPNESYFRGEALWEAASQAGRYEGSSSQFVTTAVEPFDDTYETYFSEIRGKGKAYSIIPEFRISQHINFYDDNNSNFLVDIDGAFEIPGVPSGSTVPQNNSESGFFKTFANSDFLKYFEVLKKQHSTISSTDPIQPHSITLRCKAIKKFIPYDGFYPSERTVQMVEQFIEDYSGSVNKIRGAELGEGASLRTFLKPLFAPGILYNTIKSGIAVDYPIMQGTMTKFPTNGAKREATYDSTTLSDHGDEFVTSASFAIFSSKRAESRRSVAGRTVDHSRGWDDRIPFEAILEPENFIANKRIADDEPSDWARVRSIVSFDGSGGTKYKRMMNNFLAESVDLFLSQGSLSGIRSLPQRQFKQVTPGVPYGMRVKMWRSMENARIQSGSYGNFELPQNSRVILTNGSINPYTGVTFTGTYEEVTNRENFTMYSRPSAFGVPLGLYASGSPDQTDLWPGTDTMPGTIHDFTPANGIYGSHTPPYYDGECWFDIIFFPRGLETRPQTGTPHIFQFKADETGEQYRPTLDEIFASPHAAIFRTSGSLTNNVPLAGSFTRKWRYDQEGLHDIAGSSYHVKSYTGADNQNFVGVGPASGPFVNEWAMQLDSSLNIFRKSKNGNRWAIQTKFETPMLNFNHVSVANGTLTVSDSDDANSAIPRGMWHQFGRLPRDGEGVYIQVTDIPKEWVDNHPSASLVPDPGGRISSLNKSPYVSDYEEAKTYYNKYSVPVGSSSTSYENPEMQSLIDVCGFSTDPVRVGEIREKKRIFEAIVAIPYKVAQGENKFFSLGPVDLPDYEGNTVKKLKRAMSKYVFPPKFDFVNNEDVDPIAMYVFEFSALLDQDDLSHIWQNLPPKLGVTAESSISTISHELLSNELLGDISYDANDRIFGGAEGGPVYTGEKLGKELRWMVFKVKQRAENDYNLKIGKSDTRAMPFYSYNWPYDYCSIVELAQLEASVDFKHVPDNRTTKYEDLRRIPVVSGETQETDLSARETANVSDSRATSDSGPTLPGGE